MILPKLATGLSVVLLFSTTALITEAREETKKTDKKIERIIKEGDGNCRTITIYQNHSDRIDFTNIVSLEAAMAAAEKHAQGKAFDVRLLTHGVPRYQVRVATEEGVRYLQVAADTGKVILPRIKKDSRIYDALRGQGNDKLKMDLKEAMKQAQQKVKGRIISANLHDEPGNMAYSIVIESEKDDLKNVLISGSTGKILAIRNHHGMMGFDMEDMPIPPVPPVHPERLKGPHMQSWISRTSDHDGDDFAFDFSDVDREIEYAIEMQHEGRRGEFEIIREFSPLEECQ
ncbi:PepSY domain-containing protein [Paremcibacter congregatus]|uniref:PepSY domain-containing protein n=1 Tax=Paremcibacter congregatus TaxID=2043170 RepID=UPI0030EB5F43